MIELLVICGWYSDIPIANSIVYCTFNNEDYLSRKNHFEPVIVTGYGLSNKHNCFRINGRDVSINKRGRLLSVNQNSIHDAGLSIAFLIPIGVSDIYS